MIINTINPTMILPFKTKFPNVSITFPAYPSLERISLVEETFKPKRNNVLISSIEGKIENCSGSWMYIVIKRIINDNAILMTNMYLNNRKALNKKDAMRITLADNLPAVLTSAGILSTAGFALALSSSNPIISELGTLLGRGTLLSLGMVALVLPALLVLFDKLIQKDPINKKEWN